MSSVDESKLENHGVTNNWYMNRSGFCFQYINNHKINIHKPNIYKINIHKPNIYETNHGSFLNQILTVHKHVEIIFIIYIMFTEQDFNIVWHKGLISAAYPGTGSKKHWSLHELK